MNNDLISREALKKCARIVFDKDLGRFRVVDVSDIDNAPTVEPCYQTTSCLDCGNYDKENHNCPRYCEVIKEAINSRPQGECKNCKHFRESLCENSPNGWCLIRRATQEGDLETQVPKDYYCSWFEEGGAE